MKEKIVNVPFFRQLAIFLFWLIEQNESDFMDRKIIVCFYLKKERSMRTTEKDHFYFFLEYE